MQQQQNMNTQNQQILVPATTCCYFNKRLFIFNRYAFMEFISHEKGTFLCSAL